MTKTYELSNERMIMADVNEKQHTATISVYVLDDLVKEANKADVLDKIRTEIERATVEMDYDTAKEALAVIDKYR